MLASFAKTKRRVCSTSKTYYQYMQGCAVQARHIVSTCKGTPRLKSKDKVDKSTPRLKSKDKVEQKGNVLANIFDDGADSVDPTRPNVCNSFLNKGACLQQGCRYLHFS